MEDRNVIFVAGGSTGLGAVIAEAVARQGAHVTIFGRRQTELEKTKGNVLKARISSSQNVNAVSLDLTDAAQVEAIFREQPQLPDILYCVAGGASGEIGFFADISTQDIERSMQKNYLTSAYAAHALLKLWKQDDDVQMGDKKDSRHTKVRTRRIVFISSAAALAGIAGYNAYTRKYTATMTGPPAVLFVREITGQFLTSPAAKCAQRALADTLRQELLLYSTATSRYRVHCAFPSTFVTDSFMLEQRDKPELTKRMESTMGSLEELQSRFQTAEQIADCIIKGVAKDEFAICCDNETVMLWSSMIGPSPKRGFGIVDSLLSLLTGLILWPILRRNWDGLFVKSRQRTGT